MQINQIPDRFNYNGWNSSIISLFCSPLLEIHQDAVPEEMQFKVDEQCSTSILQTTKPIAIRCFSISSTIHPYGELPSLARMTPQKPYFFRSQENQFGSQILCAANEVSFSDPAIVTGIRFIE
jgi:hypothetical protein